MCTHTLLLRGTEYEERAPYPGQLVDVTVMNTTLHEVCGGWWFVVCMRVCVCVWGCCVCVYVVHFGAWMVVTTFSYKYHY